MKEQENNNGQHLTNVAKHIARLKDVIKGDLTKKEKIAMYIDVLEIKNHVRHIRDTFQINDHDPDLAKLNDIEILLQQTADFLLPKDQN